jgi:hypothetical protein
MQADNSYVSQRFRTWPAGSHHSALAINHARASNAARRAEVISHLGKIRKSSDDMRKRGLPSPARADAMAIAFADRANAAPMNVESHAGESITGDLMTKAW